MGPAQLRAAAVITSAPIPQCFGDPILHGMPSHTRGINLSCRANCLAVSGSAFLANCLYDRHCIGPTVLQVLRKQTVPRNKNETAIEKGYRLGVGRLMAQTGAARKRGTSRRLHLE